MGELSYSDAGAELDAIIEEFETGAIDVDHLVEQLERATESSMSSTAASAAPGYGWRSWYRGSSRSGRTVRPDRGHRRVEIIEDW